MLVILKTCYPREEKADCHEELNIIFAFQQNSKSIGMQDDKTHFKVIYETKKLRTNLIRKIINLF